MIVRIPPCTLPEFQLCRRRVEGKRQFEIQVHASRLQWRVVSAATCSSEIVFYLLAVFCIFNGKMQKTSPVFSFHEKLLVLNQQSHQF